MFCGPAIASTAKHLTLESVRGLIGSAPAVALENVMQAVAESASDKILLLVDELQSESLGRLTSRANWGASCAM